MATKLSLIVACIFLAALVAAKEVTGALNEDKPKAATVVTKWDCVNNIGRSLLAIEVPEKLLIDPGISKNSKNKGLCKDMMIAQTRVYERFRPCAEFKDELFSILMSRLEQDKKYNTVYEYCKVFLESAFYEVFGKEEHHSTRNSRKRKY